MSESVVSKSVCESVGVGVEGAGEASRERAGELRWCSLCVCVVGVWVWEYYAGGALTRVYLCMVFLFMCVFLSL